MPSWKKPSFRDEGLSKFPGIVIMLRQRIIPMLLLQGRRLVKTVRFQKPVYIGDPINTVRLFNDKEADELAFVDIDASRNNKPIDFELIRQLADEAFMPLSYGGNIKSADEVRRLIQTGIE